MKILFYIHAIDGGGAERVLCTIANRFVNDGHGVIIATNIHKPIVYHIDEKVTLQDLFEKIPAYKSLISKIANAIRLRNNIRKIVIGYKPDIIIAFMAGMGCRVIFSTIGLGIPIIVSEHTNINRNLGKVLEIKKRMLYPFASCITVLTRHDYRLWNKRFKNVVYMPNPIKLDDTSLASEKEKTVLAVGRVDQWYIKGFDNLIRCWARLCHKYPDWRLKIAGAYRDDTLDMLSRLIKDMGCKNVEFLGFCQNVKQIMEQTEIFCLSSRVEGLPMALIEAMNAGCCCVSFDVQTGPREIIQNGRSGLIAKNQDNEDLIEKLSAVMADEQYRHELSSNAKASVKKYSEDRIVHRWNILFNKLIKQA